MSEKKNADLPLNIVFCLDLIMLYMVFLKLWTGFVISRSPVQVRPVAPKPLYLVSPTKTIQDVGALFLLKNAFLPLCKCQLSVKSRFYALCILLNVVGLYVGVGVLRHFKRRMTKQVLFQFGGDARFL